MTRSGQTTSLYAALLVTILTSPGWSQGDARVLTNPAELEPQRSAKPNGGELSVSLDVNYAPNKIFNPFTGVEDSVHLRSYNGQLAGPTIRVRPGDKLHVNFRNSLPQNTCVEPQGTHTIPTCFNTTNLHTHGLHVSPTGNSDNVLLELGPNSAFEYEYDLPADHPAGTFWYHPHRHGSTALQVSSGMAGALIVEGNRPVADKSKNGIADIDTILKYPDGRRFDERILLFQQISYECEDKTGNPLTNSDHTWICPSGKVGTVEDYGARYAKGAWDASGRFTTLSGKVQPTLRAEAGRIERWRMIHAGVHDTIQLAVTASRIPLPATAPSVYTLAQMTLAEQHAWTDQNCLRQQIVPQWEFAADGLTRESIQEKTANVLQPGYRSDALMVFPAPGIYCVLDDTAPASALINPEGRLEKERRLLALVQVTGGTPATGSPREYLARQLLQANPDLPAPVRDDLRQLRIPEYAPLKSIPQSEVDGRQSLVFSIDTQEGPRFGIDHLSFNPNRVDRTLKLGAVDEWTLTSAVVNHPFHIHVNAFQIERILNTKGQSIIDGQGACTEPAGDRQYCDQIGVFRDTIFVKQGYQVIMRTRYQRYIGQFVLHCHILDHEDQGMMQLIEIVPSSGDSHHVHL